MKKEKKMLASCETIAKRESKPSIVKFLRPLECIYIFYTLRSVKKKLSCVEIHLWQALVLLLL